MQHIITKLGSPFEYFLIFILLLSPSIAITAYGHHQLNKQLTEQTFSRQQSLS